MSSPNIRFELPRPSIAKHSPGTRHRVHSEGQRMVNKLNFQLTEGAAPDHYLIRLTDEKQIAAITLGEGYRKPFKLAPIAIVYDEGNGELVPVGGFDDKSSEGRIAMKVLADVYCDALDQILDRCANYPLTDNGAQRLSWRYIGR